MSNILTANEIGDVIKRHGLKSKFGWMAKFAKSAGDPFAPWITKSGDDKFALHKAYDAPKVSDLENILGVKEGENQVLSILSTEHIDRYKDVTVQSGIDFSLYNGVVLDTHNLASVDNILAHCVELIPFAFPGDGVPALAWLVEYDETSDRTRHALAMDKAGKIPACSIAYFIDTFELDNETGVQKIITSKMYEGSKCPVGVNPYASVARALSMKALEEGVQENIIPADSPLIFEATGTARRSYLLPQTGGVKIRTLPEPTTEKVSEQKSVGGESFDKQLTILLKSFSIFSNTEMDINELLAGMPNATAEQKSYFAQAAVAKAISHNKEAVRAIHDSIKESMAHREDAYAKEEEAEALHDKADACHEDAMKKAKDLLGDENKDGKKDDAKKDDAKKDSLSPRERAKQRAAQNIEAGANTKLLGVVEKMMSRLDAMEKAATAPENILSKFE